ncbi:MAG: acyl-CoA dehydratase activase [Candidatus Thorarchaeota archaeon]
MSHQLKKESGISQYHLISRYIGFNIGSLTMKRVVIEPHNTSVDIIPHHGLPLELIDEYSKELGFFGISGKMGHISEPAAIERALQELQIPCDMIISLGAEVFVLYLVNKKNEIFNVFSHNKCAAGSGEFLSQQLARMKLSFEDGIPLGYKGKSIPLASRCSVHCKTDITHKLNRNEATKADIIYSVINSMASRIVALIEKSQHQASRILLIGGGVKNKLLIKLIQQQLLRKTLITVPESIYFVAYGTALLVKDNPRFKSPHVSVTRTFENLPPLSQFQDLVTIKRESKDQNAPGPYILGIDGGSTTTKAIILSKSTNEIVASHYLRTDGDPIQATRDCLAMIIQNHSDLPIIAIGTTGSARKIIGAFTSSSCVINEISAHARGAVEFDSTVDTIFEIGGQDSKYIFLKQSVPISYAMNEACSAGTGSFIEEAAKGDLNLEFHKISDVALSAQAPVKFKDNCAAFINTDIRTASQEGYTQADIVAGVIYSIVNNYLIKVKGKRRVGKTIFFQGGVALNLAVSNAFAYATQRRIVVPPFPELMGAYGIALLTKELLEKERITKINIKLSTLTQRIFRKIGSFNCQSCPNQCIIDRLEVGRKKYPFGGRCSRWEHDWQQMRDSRDTQDYTQQRNDILLEKGSTTYIKNVRGTIGIPRAMMTHSLFPLFNTFFRELGFKVVLSDISPKGSEITDSTFCYPTEIAHGAVFDLINNKNLNLIFVPHIQKMPSYKKKDDHTHLCYFNQGFPYIAQQKFEDSDVVFLTPILDFSKGYNSATGLISLYKELNVTKSEAQSAYTKAVIQQQDIENELQKMGMQALENVLNNPNDLGVILVGRSYNAFPPETSMNISRKLTSHGITVIPFDCLTRYDDEENYWYFSNLIMNAATLSSEHTNIFILYISNFSCVVDAFTQYFLNEVLHEKPFLLLEIDSHTADAGIFTRIEAFIEIIRNYSKQHFSGRKTTFKQSAVVLKNRKAYVTTYDDKLLPLTDPRVKIYFPALSKYHTQAIAMVLRWKGIHGYEAETPNDKILSLGKNFVTGKECLPLPITIGQMLSAHKQRKLNEVVGFYMLEAGAPCVIIAYKRFFNQVITENNLENVFIFDPQPSNHYYGFGNSLLLSIPLGIVLADLVSEIKSALLVVSPESLPIFEKHWDELITNSKTKKEFNKQLKRFIQRLSEYPRSKSLNKCPKVLVTGDFFFRFDEFLKQSIDEIYAQNGIVIKNVDVTELVLFALYDNLRRMAQDWNTSPESLRTVIFALKNYKAKGKKYLTFLAGFKKVQRTENKLRKEFNKTGLLFAEKNHVYEILNLGKEYITPNIVGEAIITIGKSIEVSLQKYAGVIVIGPFNCMAFRVSEGILKPMAKKLGIPFLFYEADCSPIPSTLLRQIHVHIHQATRNK